MQIGSNIGKIKFNLDGETNVTELTLSSGISLNLLEVEGIYRGIGAVEAGGVPLRGPHRPALFDIRTPDGFQFSDWRIDAFESHSDFAELTMVPSVVGGGLMEWMLHEVRPRLNTADWAGSPERATGTSLRLKFESIDGAFGIKDAIGFRYRLTYSSERYPIYKILDRASWEIGGGAIGNSFWLRNSFAPCLFDIQSIEQHYSTEWFLPSASNSSVFQFLPWQTALEGFTLTFHELGALATWSPRVSHIRSLFEKQSGIDSLFHWHEHCGDLSANFETAPIEVIWIPGSLSMADRWNLYEAVREHVAQVLHDDIGMKRDRIAPYGVIEEWRIPDLQRYRANALPKLLDSGIKTIFLPNEFENNMNTFGVSNMCCTVDYKVAETVGEDNLRDFCSAALAGGAKVEMWGNTALSTLVPITANKDGKQQRIDFLPVEGSIFEVLKKVGDPYVRNASGGIEADHYTPVFAQLNLRDDAIRRYWMQQWTYAYQEIGVRGIFLDSSFNMTSDKFHWIENSGPTAGSGGTVDQTHLLGKSRSNSNVKSKILSQYKAHLTLMAEMQKEGYFYCGEDIGVFGIHRSGPSVAARLDNLPMWSDSVAMYNRETLDKLGADPDAVFFQGLAYRMMWFVYWNPKHDCLSFDPAGKPGDNDAVGEWHRSLFRAYTEVEGEMTTRTILPENRGVIYSNSESCTKILWSFVEQDVELPEGSFVSTVITHAGAKTNRLSAVPNQVYKIKLAAPVDSLIVRGS
jgi:hypothetical protein